MPARGPDRAALEREYVAGTMGLRELADSHRISPSTLFRWAAEDKWKDKRDAAAAKAAKARELAGAELVDGVAGELADKAARLLDDQVDLLAHYHAALKAALPPVAGIQAGDLQVMAKLEAWIRPFQGYQKALRVAQGQTALPTTPKGPPAEANPTPRAEPVAYLPAKSPEWASLAAVAAGDAEPYDVTVGDGEAADAAGPPDPVDP